MMFFSHAWALIRDTWQYRHEPENLRILADVYWRALLFAAVLILAGLMLYAGLKFYSMFVEPEGNPLLSGGGVILLNSADLQEAVEGFQNRQARYEFLKKNPPKIADPSR